MKLQLLRLLDGAFSARKETGGKVSTRQVASLYFRASSTRMSMVAPVEFKAIIEEGQELNGGSPDVVEGLDDSSI
ncbi:hypothetical protein MRB53_033023 [Persea americana]|uniref:Uncharacterized protein n=1 Tax=Persea americana TaxID=3435 RepID=A0ACC2KU25_PERAE|nr:hypothetical protein MRB53_033023 [Persea americana]